MSCPLLFKKGNTYLFSSWYFVFFLSLSSQIHLQYINYHQPVIFPLTFSFPDFTLSYLSFFFSFFRPCFYREQQSEMYSIFLYSMAYMIVEVLILEVFVFFFMSLGLVYAFFVVNYSLREPIFVVIIFVFLLFYLFNFYNSFLLPLLLFCFFFF